MGRKESEAKRRVGASVIDDERFQRIHSDPRFRRDPKKAMRRPYQGKKPDAGGGVGESAIDRRFEIAEDDYRFEKTLEVDKYGRKLVADVDLEEEQLVHEESSDSEVSDGFSGSDAEVPGLKLEEETITYGEETRRLALLSMNWDQMTAIDVLVALSSFCPSNGKILEVNVVKSNFGLEQMKREALHGPDVALNATENRTDSVAGSQSGDDGEDDDELGGDNSDEGESDDDEVDIFEDYRKDPKAQAKETNELVRNYEKSRLKYFYAVAKCDSVATAAHLYNQCDGAEYGRSGNTFDLRFIPDEVEITNPVRDSATEIPTHYKPPTFTTKALQNTQVELTWDRDPESRTVLRKKFMKEDEMLEQDLQAYLANSSSEEDSADGNAKTKRAALLGEPKVEDDDLKLAGLEEADGDSSVEEVEDLEIQFEPGLGDAAEEILNLAEEKKAQSSENPWEARLRRMRERKKEKKRARKEKILKGKQGSGEPGADEFFVEHDEEEQKEKELKRLELLMMDTRERAEDESEEDEEARLKKRGKSKQAMRERRKEKGKESKFKADLSDKRFEAVLTSSEFALDPTHPKFAKNRGTGALLKARSETRQKAIKQQKRAELPDQAETAKRSKASAAGDLQALAQRLKRKLARAEKKPRKRTKI
ncbi:hypothetical protein NDN08_005240 [Rhodosorus marinus]|uniref:NUC153 domain-containing protein n=1 Tax=Rhodosorus marinus TaxID=101924 RepID=A0AAV8V1D6_9RHOD|nr:hypothetical protein NDN08_005240 [Rhodosorus marinus]